MKKKKNKKDVIDKDTIVKITKKINRELAIENKTFHITWLPKSRVHSDKKKAMDKKESRNYRYKGGE